MFDCLIECLLILSKDGQSTILGEQTAIELRFEIIWTDLLTVY